jgi:hypothetical protein
MGIAEAKSKGFPTPLAAGTGLGGASAHRRRRRPMRCRALTGDSRRNTRPRISLRQPTVLLLVSVASPRPSALHLRRGREPVPGRRWDPRGTEGWSRSARLTFSLVLTECWVKSARVAPGNQGSHFVMGRLGIVFGKLVVPAVIDRAYRGESWSFLTRRISGQARHPLNAYVQDWKRVTLAALLSGVGFWLVVPVMSRPAVFQRVPAVWRAVAIL